MHKGINVQDTTDGPAAGYSINFSSPGTYYVWARMSCASGSDDSIHVGLNGNPVTYGGHGINGCSKDGAWTWINEISTGARVQIEVPSAGVHTFSIWMREDGTIVDKIYLTTDPNDDQVCSDGGCASEPSCVPNCAGKTCGSDGCGGSCGTCGFLYTCISGKCVTFYKPRISF